MHKNAFVVLICLATYGAIMILRAVYYDPALEADSSMMRRLGNSYWTVPTGMLIGLFASSVFGRISSK